MLKELGPNDWRFKAIKNEFESGDSTRVGDIVCNNPNAKWDQVEDCLLNADYADMVQFSDELDLEPTDQDRSLSEVNRLRKLAGIK